MVPVNLHYKGSRFTFMVPTGTDELNTRQATRLYELLHSKPTREEYLAKLALILFDVRPLDVRGRAWLGSVDGGQFEELWPILEPFAPHPNPLPEGEGAITLRALRQEMQVVPRFWWRGWYYSGPASRLANISLVEFAYADFHFLRYHANPKDEDLFALLACLYRPWRYGNLNRYGDSRERFNRYTYEARGKRFAATNTLKGHAFYALEFFQSGRAIVVERWQDLFNEKNESSAKQHGNGWVNLIYSMAGDKFGPISEVQHSRLSDVLLYCRQTKEENERAKEQIQQNH